MAAPKVQSISELMTDLAPGYDEQAEVISQQQEAVGQQFEAQRQGLEAQKDRQFNVINEQATGRGMAFSGIPLHEQADYLSTHYLPGVQASYAQENQQRLSLAGQLAQLRTEQRNRAFDTRQIQMGWVNDWNLNERNISATAEQARLNREFEASQNALNRSHDASLAAANRAHQTALAAPRDNSALVRSIDSQLKSARGRDGKVSPAAFQAARAQWVGAGGDPSTFAQTFYGYVNRSHEADYF